MLVWRVTFRDGRVADVPYGDSFISSSYTVTFYKNGRAIAEVRDSSSLRSVLPLDGADILVRDPATGRFRRPSVSAQQE